MSMAWEVTRDDVENVLNSNGIVIEKFNNDNEKYDIFVDDCYDIIDCDEVERSALYGNDMSEQIDYANLSIYEQLVEAGKM